MPNAEKDTRPCESYDQPGQDCFTAGLEVIAAEGLCGPCAMRVLPPEEQHNSAEKRLREEIARRLYFSQAQQGEHFGTEGPWWDDADAVLDILERRKTRVLPPEGSDDA